MIGLLLLCPRCGGRLEPSAEGARCAACGAAYAASGGILDLTTGHAGPAGYDPHFHGFLGDVEDAHFWFLSRRRVILEALRAAVPDLALRPLFDVGCGTGGLVAFLEREGVPIAGACDAHRAGLEVARARTKAPLLLVDDGRLPPLAPGHALLSMFDVLEHIDDDAGVLAALRDALAPGGVLVLTVPAHPALFGEADRLAMHRRRYRRAQLRRLLHEAGFEVRRLTHFMAPLVAPLLAARALGPVLGRGRAARAELRVVPVVNGFMGAVLAGERALLRGGVTLPLGTSLLAVAARAR